MSVTTKWFAFRSVFDELCAWPNKRLNSDAFGSHSFDTHVRVIRITCQVSIQAN